MSIGEAAETQRRGVVAIPIHDGAMLLQPATGQRLHLNATALDVWHQLRLGGDAEHIVSTVASAHGLEPDLVRADVVCSIDALRPWVDPDPDPGDPDPDDPDPTHHRASSKSGSDRPAGVRSRGIEDWSWIGAVGPFSALGHRFVVRADDAEVLELSVKLFGSLAFEPERVHGGRTEPPLVTYSIRSRSGRTLGASLWRDDQPVRFAVDGRGVLARLAWLINGAAVAHAGHGLALHSAAVAGGDRVVLLAGDSGAGKSTLASALAISGMDYLGDEVSVVDAALGVTGMPRSAKLSAASVAAIGVDSADAVWMDDEAHVPPDRLRRGSARTSGRLGAIVLPTFLTDGRWSHHRLDTSDAITALLPCVFGHRPFTQADADLLGEIAAVIPVHRIEFGDLAPAVSFVRDLAATS